MSEIVYSDNEKGNKAHKGPGSPEGGQFTSSKSSDSHSVQNVVDNFVSSRRVPVVIDKNMEYDGYFDPKTKSIHLKSSDYDVKFHESAHALDYLYKEGKVLSRDFVTESGRTLEETLNFELSRIDLSRIVPELKEDFYRRVAKAVGENLGEDEINALRDSSALKAKMMSDRNAVEKLMRKQGASQEQINEEQIKIYKEYKDKVDSLGELREKWNQEEVKMAKKYSLVSDMLSSLDYDNEFSQIVRRRHRGDYIKDSSNASSEFFAECSVVEKNGGLALGIVRKYFPNSLNAFRDIIKKCTI